MFDTLAAKAEFELLHYFVRKKGIVISRKLLNSVWGFGFEGESRTVDVLIRTLCQKLGDSGALISAVRSVGYIAKVKGKGESI